MGITVLKCENLNKNFGKKQILKNVSFEIEEGKGLEPDIWLGTEDILDRTYKFAKTLK